MMSCPGNVPEQFNEGDFRIMCLIHNVGEVIEAFETVSAELELAGE